MGKTTKDMTDDELAAALCATQAELDAEIEAGRSPQGLHVLSSTPPIGVQAELAGDAFGVPIWRVL